MNRLILFITLLASTAFSAVNTPPLPSSPGVGWFLTVDNNGLAAWTRDGSSLTNVSAGSGASVAYVDSISNSLYLQLVAATNLINSLLSQQRRDSTNDLNTAIMAKLQSATNNALALATNNDTVVSNGVVALALALTNNSATVAYVNAATNNFITTDNARSLTNNSATVSYVNGSTNSFITSANAQALTNNFATIPFAESLTNSFDTIVDVNSKTGLLATISYVSGSTNGFITTANAQALTNNFDTIADVNAKTNLLDTIVDVSAKLASATNNALALATNNDIRISQNATNNDTAVSNGVVALSVALTNSFDTIADVNGKTNLLMTIVAAQALTNNFDTIVDVNAKTNLLDTIVDVNAKTNLLDTIVDVTAKLVSATNNALALATNNDTLTSQNSTNTTRLAANLASSFTTTSYVDTSSQNSTNTTRLVANLASSFDAAGAGTTAAQTATNSITSAWVQGKFPSAILTNGGTVAATYSNNFQADAAHFIGGTGSFSTVTNTGLTSADAVATDSNGKEVGASAILISHIAQPGAILTNGTTISATISNNLTVDAAHTFTAAGGSTLGTATISSGGNISAANVVWSGTNAGNVSSSTNNQIAVQSANYNIVLSDSLIPINGARTATLPTAVGIPGRVFTIWTATAGTNAILTTSSQTIDGFAKWTNLSQFSVVSVISDGANWRVISTKP